MDNLRGAIFMILAMLGFALEDAVIKTLAQTLPVWQLLLGLGAGGAFVFATACLISGQGLFTREFFAPSLIFRNLGELIGTGGYVMAIALAPLALVAAVLQATPLLVTMGAALFMGETVGWRRWAAISAGLVGVLFVIQPGLDGFDPNVIFAIVGVLGMAVRDLATRQAPKRITSLQMGFYGFCMALPASGILALISGAPAQSFTGDQIGVLGLAILIGVAAYYAIIAAMRVGEVSFVTPFRYSRMIFALALAVLVFDEQPDGLMLLGTLIIIASGVYTVLRERKISRSRG